MNISAPACIVIITAMACSAQAPGTDAATDRIQLLIAKYAAAAEAADTKLAGEVWDNSPDISFIYPLGHEHGWEEVKRFYTDIMGGLFSERKLTVRDVVVHVYGDAAWAEFNWHFTAKSRSNGAAVQTDGRETQIYHRIGPDRWALVHVHYSARPPARPVRPSTQP